MQSQEGTYGTGGYSLSSVLYTEKGADTVSVDQTATETVTGSGSDTTQGGGNISASGQLPGGGFSYNDKSSSTSIESYGFSSAQTRTYNEKANDSYTLVVSGKYAGGSFSLDSTFDETGTDSYLLHVASLATLSDGLGSSTISTNGNASYNAAYGNKTVNTTSQMDHTTASSYSFGSKLSGTYDAEGKGDHKVHAEGAFVNGTWSLSCFTLDITNGSNSFTFQLSGNESFTGSETVPISGNAGVGGTFHLGGLFSFTSNESFSGSYSGFFNGTDSFSYRQNGNATFTLHAEGKFSAGTFSLQCVVYDEKGSAGFTFTEDVDLGYEGSGSVTDKGGGNATHTLTGSTSFTLANQGSSTITTNFISTGTAEIDYGAEGAASYKLHSEGSYANGCLSLSSMVYDSSGLVDVDLDVFTDSKVDAYGSFNLSGNGNDDSKDKFAFAAAGTFEQGGHGKLTDAGTFAYGGDLHTSVSSNDSATFQVHVEGKLANGSWSLDSYAYDRWDDYGFVAGASGTGNGSGRGTLTLEGDGTGTFVLSADKSGLGTFSYTSKTEYAGNVSFGFVVVGDGDGTFELHQTGKGSPDSFELKQTSKGSDTFDFDSIGSLTYHSTGTLTLDGKGGGNGNGSLSYSGTGTFTSSQTFTVDGTTKTKGDVDGSSSFNLYIQGHRDKHTKGVFSVDSFSFDAGADAKSHLNVSGTLTLSAGGTDTNKGDVYSSGTDSLGYTWAGIKTADVTDTFTYTGTGSFTFDSGGLVSWHLHQEGKTDTAANPSFPWSLSSFLYEEEGNANFIASARADGTREGKASVDRGADGTDSYGYSGDGSFNYGIHENVHYTRPGNVTGDGEGDASYFLHKEGTYGNGTLSLSSLSLYAEASSSFTVATAAITTLDGTGAISSKSNSSTAFTGDYNYNLCGYEDSDSKVSRDRFAMLQASGATVDGKLTVDVSVDADGDGTFHFFVDGTVDRGDTVCGGAGGMGFSSGSDSLGLGFDGSTDSFPSMPGGTGDDSFGTDFGPTDNYPSMGSGEGFGETDPTGPGRDGPQSGGAGYNSHLHYQLNGDGNGKFDLHADGKYVDGAVTLNHYSLHGDGSATVTLDADGNRTAGADTMSFTLDYDGTASTVRDESGKDVGGAFQFDSYHAQDTLTESLKYHETGIDPPCWHDRLFTSVHTSTLDKTGSGSSGNYTHDDKATNTNSFFAVCDGATTRNETKTTNPNSHSDGSFDLPRDGADSVRLAAQGIVPQVHYYPFGAPLLIGQSLEKREEARKRNWEAAMKMSHRHQQEWLRAIHTGQWDKLDPSAQLIELLDMKRLTEHDIKALPPSTLQSLVPVYGPWREFEYDLDRDRLGPALFHLGMAGTDVSLAKGLLTAPFKAVAKEGAEYGLSRGAMQFGRAGVLRTPEELAAAARLQASMNPRLLERLDAWKSYKAGGGTLPMKDWVKYTQGQPWAPFPGMATHSKYAAWEKSLLPHGNSLDSLAPTYLYRLEEKGTGAHVYWGMTDDLRGRWSGDFLKDKIMIPELVGRRRDIANIERELIRLDPGRLNRQVWTPDYYLDW